MGHSDRVFGRDNEDWPSYAEFEEFRVNMLLAASNTKCTVTIRSQPSDQEVRYVKSKDASDTDWKDAKSTAGRTRVTFELERAVYDFAVFRDSDSEEPTATKTRVDCTNDEADVEINERLEP